MGASAKTKQGTKLNKLPKSIFVEWNTILNNFSEKHPNACYISAVVSLKKLISLVDGTWERQSACLRESAKALQASFAKGDTSPEAVEQMKSIIEPIASSGYFAAAENLSRRQFVPLLEATAQFRENTVFQHYYQLYLTPTPEALFFSACTLSQKALTIYTTTDFMLGKDTVLNLFNNTIAFLVLGLESTQQQLTGMCDKIATEEELINDLQYSTKSILSLVSRYGVEKLQEFVNALESETPEIHQETQMIATLIRVLLDICANTHVYNKECCQVAGMAMGAVLNLSQDRQKGSAWALGWFFSAENGKNEQAERVSALVGVSPSEVLVGSAGWLDQEAILLSVVRGLVSTVREDILLAECPASFRPVKTLESYSPQNLHEAIFYSINFFCSRADLESHSKVVAFEAMAIWLLGTKHIMASKFNDKTAMSAVVNVLAPHNIDILIRYVWDHWDDPIDTLQNKVRSIFELVLEIMEIKATCFGEKKSYDEFLLMLLKNLVIMDWNRKVKYALLNILVPRLGTDIFFSVEPELIPKCIRAMDNLILSPQITSLVLSILYQRIEETVPGCKPFKGQNIQLKDNKDEATKLAIERWIEVWAVSVLKCLTSESEILRKNIGGFILQPLFKVSPQSFWYMIRILQDPSSKHWDVLDKSFRLNAFIAVLKTGRSLDIVDGSAYSYDDALLLQNSKISVETLKLAIHHADIQIRIDVLGLLCESRKASSTVTEIELEMIKLFLPLNMNSTSPEFRQTLSAHLTKFLTRLRGSMYAQYRTYRSRLVYLESHQDSSIKKDIRSARTELDDLWKAIEMGKAFLLWMNEHIATSLYPGSSYQRVSTALRILKVMIKTFGIEEIPIPEGFTVRPEFPFKLIIASPRHTKLLLDVLMNPFDFNRGLAFEMLSQFPSPLPGIESKEDVQNLLWWGLGNVVSMRAGESDSGAMIFRLIFTKYVSLLGFDLNPEQTVLHTKILKEESSPAPVIFTGRLLDMLENQVKIAKTDLLQASQHRPMHGTLLALQYVFRELNYNNASVLAYVNEWREVHTRALSLIHKVCGTVTEVLSNPSPEGNVPASFREIEEHIDDMMDDTEESADGLGPKGQVILSCCWRAVKEASSLLEVIISKAPIKSQKSNEGMIAHSDMIESGALLRSLLTTIRHQGAFSAVYPAYVSLNSRFLVSSSPDIARIPSEWLEENLDSLTSTNVSITRRSAGLPLCILAIVSSEKSTRKELLANTMQRLFALARIETVETVDENVDLLQVHAFNILRTIFMDSKLGTSVLKYASDGFSLSINGFSSSSWAIRNCSVMLFSTLLQRTFGTKKIKDEHSSVNQLTGREFFTRFPQLHPYLLKELNMAVEQLLADSKTVNVHPGLYPILTLLSRMHPSVMDNADESISMVSFIPLVTSCASSSIFKTREMAARALVPLIPSVELVCTLAGLLDFGAQFSQNELHGQCLQIQYLLRGHLYNSILKEDLIEFMKTIPRLMKSSFEVIFSHNVSYMTRALLLDILGEFFFDCTWIHVDRTEKEVEDILKLYVDELQLLRSTVLNYCNSTICQFKDDLSVIGMYLTRQQMTNIITLGNLRNYTHDAQLTDILFLLNDPDYEVRQLVMKQLSEHFKNYTQEDINSTAGIRLLQCKLVEMTYGSEVNLHCFVLATKLLMSLYSSSPYPEGVDSNLNFSLEQYWNKLNQQFVQKKSMLVTESVLPLLGSLLAQILETSSDRQWVNECFLTWCQYVTIYSHQEVTLPLREAAVESIRFVTRDVFAYSDDLDEIVNEVKAKIQLTIVQLLQDDDIDVRHTTALIASNALQLQAPVHSERAIELVNLHFAKNTKYSIKLQSLLLQSLQGEQDLESFWEEELSQTKVLFAKEAPNIYKEDILDYQWTYVNLDLLYSRYSQQLSKHIKDLNYAPVLQVANQVITCCKHLDSLSVSVMQNGPYGITSRPSIFTPTYRTVLAINLLYDQIMSLEPLPESIVLITKGITTIFKFNRNVFTFTC
ncbi:putative death-receptor fusion protein-domain-containing protein [Spinellus fusiger]|nr:putative death-receptor fusion protein-domain-containing protein [Spinellus fusiger]